MLGVEKEPVHLTIFEEIVGVVGKGKYFLYGWMVRKESEVQGEVHLGVRGCPRYGTSFYCYFKRHGVFIKITFIYFSADPVCLISLLFELMIMMMMMTTTTMMMITIVIMIIIIMVVIIIIRIIINILIQNWPLFISFETYSICSLKIYQINQIVTGVGVISSRVLCSRFIRYFETLGSLSDLN